MRDCLNSRGGFDRALMAVVASLLTVSATSALAQGDAPRSSAAELAIEAAIPRPEPANVPPPTINDFKLDTMATAPEPAKTKATEGIKPAEQSSPSPAEVATTPAAEPKKDVTTAPDAGPNKETATTPDAGPNKETATTPDAGPNKETATTPDAGSNKETATTPDAGPNKETATTPDAGPQKETPTAPDGPNKETATTPDAGPNKEAATTPDAEPKKADAPKSDTATAPSSSAPAAASVAPATEPAKDDAAKEPAKAASNVPPADQPVADKLKDMLGAKSLRYFERKAERGAVEKFYGARDYAPLWTHAGDLTETAKDVIARLKDAAAEGLNPSDYPVPDFAAAATPEAIADSELKLTNSMLDYARQAQSGRVHWSQVSGDISYPEHQTEPTEVLTKVTTANDPSEALGSYNPPQKLYKELKAKLAELRGQASGPVIEIADGPPLRYIPRGKNRPEIVVEDPRVPQLRAKLGVENPDDAHYDAKLAEAVRKFQESAELKETGVLDTATVRALNSPKRNKLIDTIIVNMERWRWMPRNLGAPSLGNAYVILNIPDYTLKVMQHGQQVWATRVVTGKPGIHATPLLSETMKFITVNPTWNVPPSIIYNEYLPALQQDPTVLERMGLRLEQGRDGSIHISQPPGEANALGRIRFNFPNKFLVYQHDTPDKYMFNKAERAFSHGCMRVQYPDQYASILLNITMPNDHYTPEKVRALYGYSEIDLKFPTPIPVNITYQTAFVDDAGKLQIRKDVYGRDATMIALLKNAHGKDLENVIARSQPSYSRPSGYIPPSGASFASGNYNYWSGPSFFGRLFGPPMPVMPPAPIGRRPQQMQPPRVYMR